MFWSSGIEHPYERTSYATYGLMAACALVLVGVWMSADGALLKLALHPDDVAPQQFITSTFAHADLAHLLGNMLFLWIYGRYLEDRLGPLRFFAVFLACAFAGDLAYLGSGATRPVVGASGAISGLMGAVLVAAPWVEVRTYLFLFPKASEPFHIAVFWVVGFWLLEQLLFLPDAQVLRVAVAAHVGGFAAGAALGALFRSARCQGTPWYLDPAPPGGGVAARHRLRTARAGTRNAGQPVAGGHSSAPVEVLLVGLGPTASRAVVAKLLMIHTTLEPKAAVRLLDQVVAGHAQPVTFPSATAADAFVAQARELDIQATRSKGT